MLTSHVIPETLPEDQSDSDHFPDLELCESFPLRVWQDRKELNCTLASWRTLQHPQWNRDQSPRGFDGKCSIFSGAAHHRSPLVPFDLLDNRRHLNCSA